MLNTLNWSHSYTEDVQGWFKIGLEVIYIRLNFHCSWMGFVLGEEWSMSSKILCVCVCVCAQMCDQWVENLRIVGTYFLLSVCISVQFSSVQSLSCVWLFATPWIAACQASLTITNSQSSLKLMSIESVMPSSHLILCRPLLLLPPIPPSISLFQWVNLSHEVAKVLEFQL